MNLIATVFVFAVVIYFQVSKLFAGVSRMHFFCRFVLFCFFLLRRMPFEMLVSDKSVFLKLSQADIPFFRLRGTNKKREGK